MAIAFGDKSAVSTSQDPTSVAVSGSDTIGIVTVVGTTVTDDISAVTWGGVGMTKIAAIQNPADRWISTWWVANPSSGAAIHFTGGTFWRSYSFYFTGAHQTAPIDSFNTGSTVSANTLSIATTVVASNCWVIMTEKGGGGTSTAAGVLTSMIVSADAGALAIGHSNGTVGTGSQTATIDQSTTVQLAGIAFSLAPSGGAPAVTVYSQNNLSLLGVS